MCGCARRCGCPNRPTISRPPQSRPAFAREPPVLCNLAKNDPQPQVRQAAMRALANIAVFSEEALQIMLVELNHTDWQHREAAAKWFGRTTPDESRVVPLLVRGLEDPAAKSEFAKALGPYGPRARFVVEPLLTLARTNDRAIASVAVWALEGIDPEAAKKAGVTSP